MPHVILHFLGLDDASGGFYLWWSGIGSDLGELTIIVGLIAIFRRHKCEAHRCWRLGRHQTAAGHHVCRRHHPDGPLSAAAIRAAHHLHLGKGPGRDKPDAAR